MDQMLLLWWSMAIGKTGYLSVISFYYIALEKGRLFLSKQIIFDSMQGTTDFSCIFFMVLINEITICIEYYLMF